MPPALLQECRDAVLHVSQTKTRDLIDTVPISLANAAGASKKGVAIAVVTVYESLRTG
jgi:hypothetical protein